MESEKLRKGTLNSENVVKVIRDDDSDDTLVRILSSIDYQNYIDDAMFATLQAAKLYSDNQLSLFMTSMSKKLESYEGTISPEEMRCIETLFQICRDADYC